MAAGCWSGGHLLTLVWGAGGAGSWPLGGGRQGRMLGRMCRSCRRGHSTWSAMPVCCEALVCHLGALIASFSDIVPHRPRPSHEMATGCWSGGHLLTLVWGAGGAGSWPLGGGWQGRVLGRRCRSCRRGHSTWSAMPVCCEALVCHLGAPKASFSDIVPHRPRPSHEMATGCWSGGHLLTLVWGAGGAGSWPLGGGWQGRVLGRRCRSCRRGHSTWSAMPVCCEALVCHLGAPKASFSDIVPHRPRPSHEMAAGCWSGGHLLTLVGGAGGAGSLAPWRGTAGARAWAQVPVLQAWAQHVVFVVMQRQSAARQSCATVASYSDSMLKASL